MVQRPHQADSTLHRLHTLIESFPVVSKERPIEFFQSFLRAPIDRDVKLRHGGHTPDFLRELRVGDEERGGSMSREQASKAITDAADR